MPLRPEVAEAVLLAVELAGMAAPEVEAEAEQLL